MSLVNLGFRERNGLIKISKKKYELVFKFKMCISSKKKKIKMCIKDLERAHSTLILEQHNHH